MSYMVGPSEIDGSWVDKVDGEDLVVRALQFQKNWGNLQCLKCDEDLSKVFLSIRSNTFTQHDISKLHLTCCLIIQLSKLFFFLVLTISQDIPVINNWIWSGPRGECFSLLLPLPQNCKFPILVIEIGKFASENTFNCKLNYLFNCRKIFDMVDTFIFLELASACREFKVWWHIQTRKQELYGKYMPLSKSI